MRIVARDIPPNDYRNRRYQEMFGAPRRTRWVLEVAGEGSASSTPLAGWERIVFPSYSDALVAATFVEEKEGSYAQFLAWRAMKAKRAKRDQESSKGAR